MPSDDDLVTLQFSSRSFADRDGAEAFRDFFGRKILRLEMEPQQNIPLQVDVTVRALPGFAIATAEMSPLLCRHPSYLIDNDDPVLVVALSGSATYRQNGREITLNPGDAALTTGGLPGEAVSQTATRIVNWRISRSLIAPLVSNFDDAIGRPIDSDNFVLPLFLGYLGVLNTYNGLANPEARRAVGTHLLDLGTLILGARRGAGEVAGKRGVAAARLHAVKTHILAELGDMSLTLGSVAAHNGISAAYVRKLFEAEGTSFSEFLLANRLSTAFRMLTDPRFGDRLISAVAHDAGFNDLSYFNRAFRRAYGCSPSEVRGESRRDA